MKKTSTIMLVGVLALVPVTRAVDRIVITDSPTGAGSLTAAIQALNDGDHITFHIPPETGEVHYIQTPANGYPLITKNDVLIDGYTQGGASANTATIHAANNAALKIVLTSTNGNALSMQTACNNSWGSAIPNFGFGDDEQAILAFFHATNATVRGLDIQAADQTTTSITSGDCKSICFAASPVGVCQNWHVSGCWFGVDPVTKQVAYMPDGTSVATPNIAIANYDTGGLYNQPGTVGVAARSANPRAEFNVFVTGYGSDNAGLNYRVSGNFFNVLPDGVTAADMSLLNGGAQLGDGYFECGGDNSNIIFGTDGDGVNDADEGNVCGPCSGGGAVCIDTFSANGNQTNMVIAGNYFNADIHGNSLGDNQGTILDKAVNTTTLRFGSDFNGVSDALEGNLAYNEELIAFDNTWPNNLAWVSMRGNALLGCTTPSSTQPPLGDGIGGPANGINTYLAFIDGSVDATVIIPVIVAGTTTTSLKGTCGLAVGAPYTNLVVDLYEADTTVALAPQGKRWIASFTDNSAADSNLAAGAFTFNTTGLGLTSGMQIVITVTYASITQPAIGSVSRAGTQTTVGIKNAGANTYGIQKSATVSPTSFSLTAAAPSGTATFTDANNPTSFYRATGPTANGQTSPFSVAFTIP